MSDDRPFLFTWEDIVLKARISSTTKLVAFAIRTHANPDGSRVFTGTARLCVLCGVSYASVKRARQNLVHSGLLELVRRGNRRKGYADEYRLIIAEDVYDRLKWLSPSEVAEAAEKINEARQAAEAARIRKRDQGSRRAPDTDQGSQATPEDQVSKPADQGSQTTGRTRFRAHRRPGSGLTGDPPPDQGDHTTGETSPRVGTATHHTRANEHDEPISINGGEASDAPSPCPRCRGTLEPDGYCLKCRVVMTHAS